MKKTQKRQDIENRVKKVADYLTENRSTIRRAAMVFGISKSTIHKDVTDRLKSVDTILYKRVQTVIEYNKIARYSRGGLAAQKKRRELQKVS